MFVHVALSSIRWKMTIAALASKRESPVLKPRPE